MPDREKEMKLSETVKNLEIISTNANMQTDITGICYDSRAVKPGNMFVAIRGFESDGHKYIPSAVAKGMP